MRLASLTSRGEPIKVASIMSMRWICTRIALSVHIAVTIAGSLSTHLLNGANIGGYVIDYSAWMEIDFFLCLAMMCTWGLAHALWLLFGPAASATTRLKQHGSIIVATILAYCAPGSILDWFLFR